MFGNDGSVKKEALWGLGGGFLGVVKMVKENEC
jgi:hypothetical protein